MQEDLYQSQLAINGNNKGGMKIYKFTGGQMTYKGGEVKLFLHVCLPGRGINSPLLRGVHGVCFPPLSNCDFLSRDL